MSDQILEVRRLHKSFSGITAVDGLNMGVDRNSITGLIGPNGAGKSTAFNLITGTHTPDEGTVVFDGEDITGRAPHDIAQRGIGRTFQHPRVFGEMTVRENLSIVPCPAEDKEREIERLVSLVDLHSEEYVYANQLSGGQQVLLGIIRTLMLQPKLLMLDEPFAGVNPGLVANIADLLRTLREDDGVTVFLIDHEIDTVSELCDEVIVMHQGQELTKGDPGQVRRDEQVIEAYLGGM